jgi:hypothetical protein
VTDPVRLRALINGVVAGLVTLVIGSAVVVGASEDDLLEPTPTPSGEPSATAPACAPTWELVQAADPNDVSNALLGVVAIAGTDAWSVGGSGDPAEPAFALIERWDGSAWTAEEGPNPAAETNELLDVDASGTSDVWAVGRSADEFGDRPLAMRFDGIQWEAVELPEELSGRLTGVAVIGPDDIWAVGYSGSPDALTERALLLHWDGTLWADVDAGRADGVGRSALLDIDALASDDVWAAGYLHNRPLMIRFDGEAWSRMESDARGTIQAIEPLSSDDGWAVGDSILRFDGSTWVEDEDARPPGRLSSVAAVGEQDVWAVGAVVADVGTSRALVMRFDGQGWAIVDGPRVPGSEALIAVDALPDGTVIATGHRDVDAGRRTFAIRAATCPGIA